MNNSSEIAHAQKIIFRNLVHNKKFLEKVIGHLEEEFFEKSYRDLIKMFRHYFFKKGYLPNFEFMMNLASQKIKGNEKRKNSLLELIEEIYSYDKIDDEDFLFELSEQFLQEKNIQKMYFDLQYHFENQETSTIDFLKANLSKRLGFSLDKSEGTEYFEKSQEIVNYLFDEQENRLSSGIPILDEILGGGFKVGTSNLIIAGSGMGKTSLKVFIGRNVLMQKKNVLIITLEMDELEYSQKMTTCLLDKEMAEIRELTKKDVLSLIEEKKGDYNLTIKGFPIKSVTVEDLRSYIIKKNTHFDAIFFDYVGLIKPTSSKKDVKQSHESLEEIAEGLKKIAQDFNTVVITSHQLQRGKKFTDDVNDEDIAGSYGVIRPQDSCFALFSDEENYKKDIIFMKNLKFRHGRTDLNKLPFKVNFSKNRFTYMKNHSNFSVKPFDKEKTAGDPSNSLHFLNNKRNVS